MGNPTMTEELEQLLKNLKLRRMLEIYDEQLHAADKDDISYSEFVTRLVRAQFQARQEGALEWRFQPATAQATGAAGRASGGRTWVFESETRAVEYVFQADGRALSPARHHHYDEPGL